MKSKRIRILSLFLTVCMVVSILSVPASAGYVDILNKNFTPNPFMITSFHASEYHALALDAGTDMYEWMYYDDLSVFHIERDSSASGVALNLQFKYTEGSVNWLDLFASAVTLDGLSFANAAFGSVESFDDCHGLEAGTKITFNLNGSIVGKAIANSGEEYGLFCNGTNAISGCYLYYEDVNGDINSVYSSGVNNGSNGDGVSISDITYSFVIPEDTYAIFTLSIMIPFQTLGRYPTDDGFYIAVTYGSGRTQLYVSGRDTVTSGDLSASSSSLKSYVNSQVSALSAELQAHKDDVAAELEVIANQLDQIGATQDQIETYLSKVVTELNGFGTDVDTALAYLNGISKNSATIVTALNTIQTKIDTTNSKLTSTVNLLLSMDTSLDTLVQYTETLDNYLTNIQTNTEETNTWLYNIYDALDVILDSDSTALEYLTNMDNSLTFISDSLSKLEELTGTSNDSLREVVSYLVSIDDTGASAASYLQNINTNIADIEDDTSAMLELIETSNETITTIYNMLVQMLIPIRQNVVTIANNLIAQGTSLESVLSLLETISESSSTTAANTTTMTSQLETLLESLEQVEIDNAERNERLAAIEELLADFEVNVQQTVNEVYTDSDKDGLSGILSNIVSRLSSLINFAGDMFGNMLTAIPDLIGGFNESLSFWGTEEVYEYSPYQIAYYSNSGGEDYTNSNSAVQTLFTEAERYLGYPYVWGGASPETSFDCSGYVSYVLDNSGVYPTSRLTAQGLYNICTPIDPSEAMPGDLIFFTGTYDTSDAVTHVGFYAGDGQMLHCGDPIQYTSCETAYWTSHFYAYGRLPYNDVSNNTTETEE